MEKYEVKYGSPMEANVALAEYAKKGFSGDTSVCLWPMREVYVAVDEGTKTLKAADSTFGLRQFGGVGEMPIYVVVHATDRGETLHIDGVSYTKQRADAIAKGLNGEDLWCVKVEKTYIE